MEKVYSITKMFALLAAVIFLSGCAEMAPGGFSLFGPRMTPEEIQSMQTREYKASKEMVFSSVIAAFQNFGYTIVKADKESGFITAKSLLSNTNCFESNEEARTKVTAFIEPIGNTTRVRLNFVKTIRTTSYAQQRNDFNRGFLDPGMPQDAWHQGPVSWSFGSIPQRSVRHSKVDRQILSPEIYTNAFERIQSEIAIH